MKPGSFSLRHIAPVVALAIALVASIEPASAQKPAAGTVVERALFVSLRGPGATPAAALELARRVGLEPLATSPLGFVTPLSEKRSQAALQSLASDRRARVERLAAALGRVVELRYGADVDPHEAARRMMTLGAVEYAEPIPAQSAQGVALVPNDSLIGQQQHLERIRAYEAWDVWPGDSATVIGIVDAGIDNTHEDLVPNIAENPGEEGFDAQNRDKRTNGFDDDGNGVIDDWRGANMNAPDDGSTPGDTRSITHGTAVAGLAAATTNNRIGIAGVAYRCQFFPVKTMPISGGSLTKAYAGIEYCARRGHKVVNASFGDRDFSRTLQNFVTYLIELYDVAIVAAGGNNPEYDSRYPAGYRGVMGVGALDGLDGFVTTFGEQVDVSAPVGASTIDNNAYAPGLVATSFSSPVAAGVVALARSRWPQLSAVAALAHVRRTSDPVNVGGERFRLSGYGRVNALRAVSVDPMSHPAVVIDTLWLVDSTGTPRETFELGASGQVRVRLRNLLGDAGGLRARIVDYRDADGSVLIDSTWRDVGALASGATHTVTLGWPFRLDRPDENPLKLRLEITGDGGYDDWDFAAPFIYLDRPSIAIYSSGALAVSVSSRGNIGYADYPENTFGVGVTWDDKEFLFEGGFLAATDAQRVVSNVRDETGDAQDRDFLAIELPTAGNGNTLTLSDAAAPEEHQIGLELRTRTIARPDVPNAFAISVRARNVHGAPFDSLRMAMFGDWDLAGRGDGQSIVTRLDPTSPVPIYALIEGAGYVVATGAVAPDRAPILYAIDNAGELNLYQGFDRSEKWITLGNGIGRSSVGPADVSLVVGRVLPGLERDEEDSVRFVVGIGRTEEEAVRGMRSIATEGPSGVETGDRAVAGMLGQARPNPSSVVARIAVDLRSGATLALYDALGRRVADLSHLIPAGGRGDVVIATGSLAPGLYVLRAGDGRGTASAIIRR